MKTILKTDNMRPRELKFRVWNGEQMVSPDYINRSGVAFWEENSIPSMSNLVMEFTGLYDKNGKEIYEGDIVIAKTTAYDLPAKGVCEYVNASFAFNVGKSLIDDEHDSYFWPYLKTHYDFEVIGNIYENPESVQ